MSDIEDRAKVIILSHLGIVGAGIGHGIQFSEEAEICQADGYLVERRWGEDWRGGAESHQRRMRNRTHRRVIRPKGR